MEVVLLEILTIAIISLVVVGAMLWYQLPTDFKTDKRNVAKQNPKNNPYK